MLLKTLLSSIKPVRVEGSLEREIAGIAYDSRRVKKDFLFVALRGEKADGESFAAGAIDQGAAAVAGESFSPGGRATRIVVENARAALADLAAAFYKRPADHLKVVGITGTNGKTTTAFLLKHICESALLRCGLLGTVRYEVGERRLPAPRTTPESLDLQELLHQIRSAGCKAVVMEVSSHALMQERVRHIDFDTAIFTNLTQDHLDYHKTMEAYFEAKTRLFTGLAGQQKKRNAKAVINLDDRYGGRLVSQLEGKTPVVTYGMGVRADFRASN